MTSPTRPAIWFIQTDHRLHDNPALHAAAAMGPVWPVYVHSSTQRTVGGASGWALHHSLAHLARQVPLTVLAGDPLTLLPQLAKAHNAVGVAFNMPGFPNDAAFAEALSTRMPHVVAVPSGNLLHTPASFRTGEGNPYKVFTPFWNKLRAQGWQAPQPAYTGPWYGGGAPTPTATLNLLPQTPNWAKGWEELWPDLLTGEDGARRRLTTFLHTGLKGYATLRDRPDLPHTSGLSTALHWGHLSPRTVVNLVEEAVLTDPTLAPDAEKFLAELGWREFCRHLLWHFPHITTHNWKPTFDAFPWVNPTSAEGQRRLHAWQTGQTGYPLVDAGMRQLWQTGLMHNRVRMVAASFLTKHLRLPWQVGEAWFWDTLLDANPASNAASWQWVAGCGADAAPYFRIFNPMEQARKFDPASTYIRRWCPEVGTPAYPPPVVNHATARAEALAAYAHIKAE